MIIVAFIVIMGIAGDCNGMYGNGRGVEVFVALLIVIGFFFRLFPLSVTTVDHPSPTLNVFCVFLCYTHHLHVLLYLSFFITVSFTFFQLYLHSPRLYLFMSK